MPDEAQPTFLGAEGVGQMQAQNNRIRDGYERLAKDPTQAASFGLNPAQFATPQGPQPDEHDARFTAQPSGQPGGPDSEDWIRSHIGTLAEGVQRRIMAAGIHLPSMAGVAPPDTGAQAAVQSGAVQKALGATDIGQYQPGEQEAQALRAEGKLKGGHGIHPPGTPKTPGEMVDALLGATGMVDTGAGMAGAAEKGAAEVVGENAGKGAKSVQEEEALREDFKSAWARAGGDKNEALRDMYVSAHAEGREDVIQHLEQHMSPDEVAMMQQYTGRPVTGAATPGARGPATAAGGEGSGAPPKPPKGEGAASAAPEEPEQAAAEEAKAGPTLGDHMAYYQDLINRLQNPKNRASYTQKWAKLYDTMTRGAKYAEDPEFQKHMLNLSESTKGETANAEQMAGLAHLHAEAVSTHISLAARHMESYLAHGLGSPEEKLAATAMMVHSGAYIATLGLRGEGFLAEAKRVANLAGQTVDKAEGTGPIQAMTHYTNEFTRNWNNYRKTGDMVAFSAATLAHHPADVAHAFGSIAQLGTDAGPKASNAISRFMNYGLLSGGPFGPIRKGVMTTLYNVNHLASSYLAEKVERLFTDNPSQPAGTARAEAQSYLHSFFDQAKTAARTMTGDTGAHNEVRQRIKSSGVFGWEDLEREVKPTNDQQSIAYRAMKAIDVPMNSWTAISDADAIGIHSRSMARYAMIEAKNAADRYAGETGIQRGSAEYQKVQRESYERFKVAPTKWMSDMTENAVAKGIYNSEPTSDFAQGVLYASRNWTVNIPTPWKNFELPWFRILAGSFFFRTQANVIARGMELSLPPLGYHVANKENAAYQAAQGMRNPDYTTNLIKSTLPSVALTMGLGLGLSGLVTGPASSDPVQARLQKQGGYVENSLAVPFTRLGISAQRWGEVAPFFTLMMIGASTFPEAFDSPHGTSGRVFQAVYNTAYDFMQDISIAHQIYSTMEMISNMAAHPDKAGTIALEHYGELAIPGSAFWNSLARHSDRAEQLKEAMLAHVDEKGTGYKVHNIYGERLWPGPGYYGMDSPGRAMSFADWALGMGPRSKQVPADYKEFIRLHNSVGWKPPLDPLQNHILGGLSDGSAGAFTGKDPTKVGTRLSPDEETQFYKLYANRDSEIGYKESLEDAVKHKMGSEIYRRSTDHGKTTLLEGVFSDYKSRAAAELERTTNVGGRVRALKLSHDAENRLQPEMSPEIKFAE